MNKAKVIDTSYHKGYIDWQAVKDGGGVEGVILKASDGFFMPDDMEGTTWTGHSDPSFILYWKEVKELFAWRGAYHFLRVDDEIAIQRGRLTSQEQIRYFYDLVVSQGLEWDDYIIIDAEQSASQIDYLDSSVIAKRVKDAVALAEELFGRKVMVYTGAWWWE
jgi:GH25 family lysozyme M1 (1,4-beta-N-acetylmuramidase)